MIKSRWNWKIALALATAPCLIHAAEDKAPPLPEGVVVRQSGVALTMTDIDGRLASVPPDKRAGFMNDPERIEQTLRGVLLQHAVAAQAVELGISDDPVVKAEIEHARSEILARRRISRFMKSLPTPDTEALAQEVYLANPDAYSTPDLFDVRQMLVAFREHGVDAAKQKAASLLAQYRKEGGEFEDFVKQHSDEANLGEHGGLLKNLKKGDTEPDFESAMFALKPGEISEPVKTKYGIHLIQLVSRTGGKRIPYEEVKAAITDKLITDYRERERDGLLARIRSGALDADPDLVASLRTRYAPGGEGQTAIQASELPAKGEYERFATANAAGSSKD